MEYRILRTGEIVRDGDELMLNNGRNVWMKCICTVGNKVGAGDPLTKYRRPFKGRKYRYLRGHEIIRKTDQYKVRDYEGWKDCYLLRDGKVASWSNLIFRRKRTTSSENR